jgi:hypothetical protein
MGIDVAKAIVANATKQGTVVVSSPRGLNGTTTMDDLVYNKPTIESVQTKWEDRFDDLGYYTA